ncbi:MAG: TetR family transcriptional regulator [Aeromicrobium sp.]|uniref:TetR family transcriptional regulator n=1 Tax=Aeromicrobium sp. TaxID=1871063 RepID=UPI0039E5F6DC
MSESVALSRREQKERTRQAILDAALRRSGEVGFAQLSLRQVAKDAGIVPTAFYRHFASMDEVGLALVEECFGTLRTMIREAQKDPDTMSNIIDASAEILVRAVKENKGHFGFVARERQSGSQVVREAITRELELFISELALVLARLPNVERWSSEDVTMAAGLFVRNMVFRAEQVIALPEGGRPEREEEIKRKARREMRLIVLGFEQWES